MHFDVQRYVVFDTIFQDSLLRATPTLLLFVLLRDFTSHNKLLPLRLFAFLMSLSFVTQVLEIWATYYGAEAGVMGLRCIPTGGLFLAGGMTHKLIHQVQVRSPGETHRAAISCAHANAKKSIPRGVGRKTVTIRSVEAKRLSARVALWHAAMFVNGMVWAALCLLLPPFSVAYNGPKGGWLAGGGGATCDSASFRFFFFLRELFSLPAADVFALWTFRIRTQRTQLNHKGADSPFMKGFYDKGRVSGLLKAVPVYAVLVEDVGLRGAHFVASRVR